MTVNGQTIRLMDEARNELALTINSAVTPIQQRYVTIAQEASDELRRVIAREAAESAAGQLTLGTMRERERIISALNATRAKMDDVGLAARSTLRSVATSEVIPLGVNYNDLMVGSQIGPGYAQMGSRILPETLEELAVRAGQRGIYLTDVGAATTARVEAALTRGILVGDNPRRVAQRLGAEVGGILKSAGHSATRIMRTEMLDVYRNADILARQANADVLAGWRWHSAGDFNTCASCWAMHGEVFPVGEPGPDDHPNGRCTSIPLVRGDVALDVPPAPSRNEMWARLSPAEQRRAIGPTRVQLLKEGVPWSAFSTRMPEPLGWRQYRVATPLSALPKVKAPIKSVSVVKQATLKKATKATASAPVKKAPAKKKVAARRAPAAPTPSAPTSTSGLADFGGKVMLPDGRQAVAPFNTSVEMLDAAAAFTTTRGNSVLARETAEAFAAEGFANGKAATRSFATLQTTTQVRSVGDAVAHWVRIGNENVQSLLRTGKLSEKATDAIAEAAASFKHTTTVPMRRLVEDRARAATAYLDDGIARSTEHGGFVGYRGVNGEHIAKHFGDDFHNAARAGDRRLVGLEFTDDAFSAVSVDPKTANLFAMQGDAALADSYLFEIRVPPTKPALSVNGSLGRAGSQFVTEEEFILGRGSKYRIVEVIGNQEQVYRDAMQAAGSSYPHNSKSVIVLEVIG